MERARRQQPEDRSRTSQLIQQLAAQRERKLQQAPNSTAAGDVVTASSVPSPSSFDEKDALTPAELADTTAAVSKPRSRLVRQDHATQQQSGASAIVGADVDGLADLLQGVGISAPKQRKQQPHACSRPSHGDSTGDSSTEDRIDDEDDDFDDAGSSAAAGSNASAAATQRRRATAAAAAGHSGSQRHAVASDSDEDAASVDSASSGPEDSSSSVLQDDADHSTATALAAAAAMSLDGGFCLEGVVAAKLYPHQVAGVQWLWSLHRMGKGGILADDMGLGKTMQCSAFLAGALAASRNSSSSSSSSLFKPMAPTQAPAAAAAAAAATAALQSGAPTPVRALIVAPKTLLAHWEKELRVCGMGRATHSFYGSSEGERSAVLTTITRRGGIMLTTYGMVLHNASQLMSGKGTAVARDIDEHEDDEDMLCPEPPQGRRILWDYIILDEGHKIKNARTQLAQRLREIRARVRLIISGTPVQNNLGELHALMEFAVPGLLGSAKDFKAAYEKPINAGQDRSATLRVRELGAARAAELRQLVTPYILRREKKEVLGDGGSSSNAAASSQETAASSTSGTAGVIAAAAVASSSSAGAETAAASSSRASATAGAAAGGGGGAAGPAPMGKKTDLVVWLKLTALQRHIYEAFLHSDAVKAALNSSKSPLAALTVLKKVCDHPALLSERATKLVVSAASKPSRLKNSSAGGKLDKQGSKAERRNSLDDFIVGDSDDNGDGGEGNADNSEGSSGYDSDEGSEDGHSGDNRAGRSKTASRAAVAASLDVFSEDFLSWATAGGGEDLEHKLLSDVGARGTESSCKSLFVTALLDELVAAGHRTLVFSQSRVMLDILQAAVKARGWNFCRIDGSMARADARQAEVERFQTAARGARGIPVFLLTTQVGGLGLTLTAADRVVIVDPSWNPATDNQSVDRAYRIGQSRDVVVYRLVTCGTVEEKIYRKQVFKGGLSKAGMEEGIQLRYFTHQELHELFKWDPDALNASETQQLLKQQHAQQLRELQKQQAQEVTTHICWVEDHPLCAGTSQHSLLFSLEDPEGKQLNISAAAAAAHSSSTGGGSSARQFRDSGWQPRKGIGSSSSASEGARGFHGPEGGAGGGSSGSSLQPSAAALDEMMQSLHIGGGTGRGSAVPGARSGGAGAGLQQQKVQELVKRIKQLQVQWQNACKDLQQLGPKLPDGGAKIAAHRDSLQASLNAVQAELQGLDPEAAAAAAAGPSASHSANPGRAGAVQQQLPHKQPLQQLQPMGQQQQQQEQQYPCMGALGFGHQQHQQQPRQQQQKLYQQQQQQWQQQGPVGVSDPGHRQQHSQHSQHQPWQQQQHQQPQWLGDLPPPPPVQPQQQQQRPPGLSKQQPFQQMQRSSTTAATSGSSSNSSIGHIEGQRAVQPDVQTLDGRVPTVDELKQRKHVLKKALQHEDRLKAQLQAQGREYPADKQQQWLQMYGEYKEVKEVLQAVADAEAAEQQAGAGYDAASRQGLQSPAVVDLTSSA